MQEQMPVVILLGPGELDRPLVLAVGLVGVWQLGMPSQVSEVDG